MATIDNKEMIDALVREEGVYPGDEDNPMGPVVRVVEYTNQGNVRVWGIVYLSEARIGYWNKYTRPDRYIRDPKEYWRHPDVANDA